MHTGRLSDKIKDLEIMILGHQLDVMTHLQTKPFKPYRVEKLTLAMLSNPPLLVEFASFANWTILALVDE